MLARIVKLCLAASLAFVLMLSARSVTKAADERIGDL
jgi:hypothetical protein